MKNNRLGLAGAVITGAVIITSTINAKDIKEFDLKIDNNTAEIILSTKITIDKNSANHKEIIKEAKHDAKRLTNKYAKLKGICKIETKVDSETEKKTRSYKDKKPKKRCKECRAGDTPEESALEETEEDCGCGLS